MTKVLTAASVGKLRAAERGVREIPDGQAVGLYLLIYPSKRKVWALRYRRPGDRRPAKLTLGSVFDSKMAEPDVAPVIGGHLSLAGARRLVAELKHEIALGRDPGKAHIAKKRGAVSAGTFADAAEDFVEQHAKRHTRRWKDTARVLGVKADQEIIKNSLCDRWRSRSIGEITEDDISNVVDDAREKGIPGLKRRNSGPSEARARKLHAALSEMFSWLKEKRRVKVNPFAQLTSPHAADARNRVFKNAEIQKFWLACDRAGRLFGPLLKLLLLTGCRLNEVAAMRRCELSDDGLTWTIPSTRTKNHRDHFVPLPLLARDILDSVQQIEGVDLIFTTTGNSPASGWSKLKKRLDDAMKIPPWRLHDLRRTCATGMAEIGVPPHIVEAVLNHVSGYKAGVAGIYNRAAYATEKKAALERWARYVALVIDKDLHAAHEKFLGRGNGKARATFAAAIAEGSARWDRYLKTIAAGEPSNVVAPRGA